MVTFASVLSLVALANLFFALVQNRKRPSGNDQANLDHLYIVADGVIDIAPLTQKGALGCVRIAVSASGGGAYQ